MNEASEEWISARARRAMDKALMELMLEATQTIGTLVATGRGVAHHASITARTVLAVTWSKAAREELDARRVTGFEPAYQFEPPRPESGITPAQLREAEAALAATAYTPITPQA